MQVCKRAFRNKKKKKRTISTAVYPLPINTHSKLQRIIGGRPVGSQKLAGEDGCDTIGIDLFFMNCMLFSAYQQIFKDFINEKSSFLRRGSRISTERDSR